MNACLEIKCRSDFDSHRLFGIETWDKLISFKKVMTSQVLSNNTNSLAVPNYMGH